MTDLPDSPVSTLAPPVAAVPAVRKKRSLAEVLTALRRPKVAIMLALGFSSGLPFMLIGNTLNYWLGDAHVDLAVIGFASWIGLTYIFKFVWGAVVDNIPPPFLSRFGRRRGWMLIAQVIVGAGLLGMASRNPTTQLAALVAFGVATALAAATQDTVVDAWRIESSADTAELDLMTSAYSLGYRMAIILTASVILFMASRIGWPLSYAVFAVAMAVGITATLMAKEPARGDGAMDNRAMIMPAFSLARIFDAVAGPLIAFFRTFGPAAILILLMVTTYHLCDYLRGPVINPFYVRMHIAKDLVGAMRLTVGTAFSMIGVAAGGLFAARFGHMPALIVGAVLQPLAVAAFAVLVVTGPDPRVFAGLMAFDDFCMSFAGLVLIVYLSTLTSLGYTATQYALLTSALNWSGKTLKGFSGQWVKDLAHRAHDLPHAYAAYFVYAAIGAGAPALLLVLALTYVERRRQAAGLSTSARTS